MGFSTYLTHIDNFFSQSFSRILYVKVLLLPCYLFVFYHLLTDKTARKILHNHTTVIMLLLNFISLTVDLPLIISYNRQGTYIPFSPALCLTHQFFHQWQIFQQSSYLMLLWSHYLISNQNFRCWFLIKQIEKSLLL